MAMTFLDDVAEVTSDTILVNTPPTGVVQEARANLWAFSVTPEQARGITPAQVEQFLHAIMGARSRELVARDGGNHPMYFYCWCDEQAAQLRFSLVSVLHGHLPFARPITPVPELSTIIVRFLAFPNHDGIQLGGSVLPGAANNTSSAADPVDTPPQPLEVWIRQLPVQAAPPSE